MLTNNIDRYFMPVNSEVNVYCAKCNNLIEASDESAYLRPQVNIADKSVRTYQYAVVCEDSDDDAKAWRCFCKPCFESLSSMSPVDIYKSFKTSKWSEAT